MGRVDGAKRVSQRDDKSEDAFRYCEKEGHVLNASLGRPIQRIFCLERKGLPRLSTIRLLEAEGAKRVPGPI